MDVWWVLDIIRICNVIIFNNISTQDSPNNLGVRRSTLLKLSEHIKAKQYCNNKVCDFSFYNSMLL